MKTRLILAACISAFAFAGCATVAMPPSKSYSPDEIVAMSKAGQAPAAIIKTLQDGRSYYSLPASELARMSKAGAPDEVINYLQASQLEAARLADRQNMYMASPFWYGGLYGPRFCYSRGGLRGGWASCF